MTKQFKLMAQTRTEENGKISMLRKGGFIPAVLYGKGEKNSLLKVKKLDLERIYEEAGESSIIDLAVDDKNTPTKILIKELQKDYVKDVILHADFYKVDMAKEIEVEIPLEFTGEAKAETGLGGTLVKNLETLNAKCLPTDLVENFEVDISSLATFDDSIKVEDIKVPETIEILNNPLDSVASVLEPKEEEEEVPEATEEAAEGEEGKDLPAQAGGEAKDAGGEAAPAESGEAKKGGDKEKGGKK